MWLWTAALIAVPLVWIWILRLRYKLRHAADHETDFNQFVTDKAQGDGNPYGFDQFIVEQASSSAAVGKKRYDADDDVSVPKYPIAILFGTEYGFAKEISEKIASQLFATGLYRPKLMDMADHEAGVDFNQEQVVLVVCSTQGDGVPPNTAREFCDWLQRDAVPITSPVSFSVLALGDKSYTHYCRCGKRIDEKLHELGAKRFVARADVDKENWKVIDAWIADVTAALPSLSLTGTQGQAVSSDNKATKAFGKNKPFYSALKRSMPLCVIESKDDKETIHYEFDLLGSGLTYQPGDALGIYPLNSTKLVDSLLAVARLDANVQVEVPRWHYQEKTVATSMSLRDVLRKCFDLHFPKPSLFATLLKNTPSSASEQRKKLTELLSVADDSNPESAMALYLKPRHVDDILREFSSASLSHTELLDSLRPLQPRLYSISSSPAVDPDAVSITVAIVRYESLGTARGGVATTYLADCICVGSEVPVYIHKNPDFRLPASSSTPIIMIGPGTGLAPFMSFIHQRVAAGSAFGKQVLFFGCRKRTQDYLYGAQLDKWHSEQVIELHTAFSRDQAKKIYVQDRIREAGAEIWSLIANGAHVYVCGDASSMAGQVEEELLAIAVKFGDMSKDGAAQWLESLSESHRYERDVWF